METTDEDVLRLAKALAVDADAVLLDGVSSEERMKLLERACCMRDEFSFLTKHFTTSSGTEGTGSQEPHNRIMEYQAQTRKAHLGETKNSRDPPFQDKVLLLKSFGSTLLAYYVKGSIE